MKRAVQTKRAPAPVGPYNQAIIAGNWVFTAGQIAIDPADNEVIRGTVEEQTHLVMKNLSAVLAEAGCSLDDVVKTTIFIKDMEDFGRINAVYAEYFTGVAPARSTVEVARLPKDVLVEIDCIAMIPSSES